MYRLTGWACWILLYVVLVTPVSANDTEFLFPWGDGGLSVGRAVADADEIGFDAPASFLIETDAVLILDTPNQRLITQPRGEGKPMRRKLPAKGKNGPSLWLDLVRWNNGTLCLLDSTNKRLLFLRDGKERLQDLPADLAIPVRLEVEASGYALEDADTTAVRLLDDRGNGRGLVQAGVVRVPGGWLRLQAEGATVSVDLRPDRQPAVKRAFHLADRAHQVLPLVVFADGRCAFYAVWGETEDNPAGAGVVWLDAAGRGTVIPAPVCPGYVAMRYIRCDAQGNPWFATATEDGWKLWQLR